MNENDARNALLIRAFEAAPATPHWDDEDRQWASRSAAQIEGEKASAGAFVSRRAALAAERLASRVPAVAHALAAVQWRPWAGWLVVAAALLAGLVLDALSADKRINILAPPILAILLWNLTVYLLVAIHALAGGGRGPQPPPGGLLKPMQRLLARLMMGLPRSLLKPDAASPLALFVRQWLALSGALNAARAAAVMHRAAAAFAIGAVAGLYVRGLAFEYVAGWESTFLNVGVVGALLKVVLGPASFLTGIGLPDEARLAAMRLPGGVGENAAGWIHLYAVTVLLVVVVPRIALGGFQSLRARHLAANLPVPLTDGYFQNLRRLHTGHAARVRVLPYSYQPSPPGLDGLRRLMQQVYGNEVQLSILPPVPLGGEDHLETVGREPVALTLALFSLSATPEYENHANFVAALVGALPANAAVVAVVDESAFIRRFGATSERLGERRATWRRILSNRVDIEPVFVSLESEDMGDAGRKLSEVLDEISGRVVQNARFRAGAKASA